MNNVRRSLLLTLLSAALAFAATAPTLSSERYLEDVRFLASDALKGRGTGMPGLEKAADWIVKQFKEVGLQPVAGTYVQKFPVTAAAKLGKHNKLVLHNGNEKESLKLETDFTPLNFSSAASLTGQVVFAGYGISATEYNYDDFAGLDVKDKIVVLFRREPQEYDEKSVFSGKAYTRHAQFDSKASNAKMHGAKAVIMLTDLGGNAALEKFGRTGGPANTGIPFVQIKSEVAEKWFTKAGKNLREIHDEIDKDLKPRSFAMPEGFTVDLRADIEREVKTVRNIVGYLPGETDEYVVIGAHYDHLGLGEQFSMAPSMAGKPHPGADDNASGTAGVLELARYFAGQPKRKRGILFLSFAGEEWGLLGSSYYVNNPLISMDKAVAMINMDMIGRIRDGKVFVAGSGTGSSLKGLMEELRKQYPSLQLDFSEQAGYGSSDHTSFTTKQVPVLFFFSGLHGDYHKPSDTWDKINSKDAVVLLDLVSKATERLRTEPEKPQYVRVMPPAPSAGAHSSGSGGGGGYGPNFGSIPDFAEPPRGVRFADVRDGTPAHKAGLKAGDILIEFDGKAIQNLYDFTYALRSKKPGDEVVVKVIRGSEELSVKVLLTARK